MRAGMMPRVDDSPSREQENRGHKKPAEDALAKQKLADEKDKRAKKHQTPA